MKPYLGLLALAICGCDESAPARVPFGIDKRPTNSTCLAPPRPTPAPGVGIQQVWPQLQFANPVAIRQAPDDASRWFVVEKGGVVRTFPNDPNAAAATVFIDHTAKVNSSFNESGLLGMAFHPNWSTNHQIFLSYTAPSATSPTNLKSTISRFTSSDGGKTVDPASEQVLLAFDQPYENHNGGNILFGPDGYLYIGFGDGGSGGDPMGNGQNVNVLFGKMLRINVDSGSPYDIPPSNPFASGGGAKEIYAWGLRNPWRWSFDRATGDLWLGDVGQNLYEEVDKIQLGGNYGWNTTEGLHCYATMPCDKGGIIDPLVEYDHTVGNCVIGGYVYRGSAIPSLVGTYIYGDNGVGAVWALTFDPITGKGVPVLLGNSGTNPSSFGEGVDGEIYLVPYGTPSVIRKLVPTASPGPSSFPEKLSQTGCVDTGDATKPASGLIPYDVNTPLWSDGASKRRWLALPDGGKVHINDDGDFAFPIGTVLMKEFSLGGKRVETRLFMRHSDGDWAGYSYEWNDAGTDATLLPASLTKDVNGQTWLFPSRDQCLECHTLAAGRALGPEIIQLDRDYTYAGNRLANQLTTWDHIGLFDNPLPSPSPSPAPLVAPDSTNSTAEARARSYLHANCSFCHRPNSNGRGPADYRFSNSLMMLGVCNVAPTQGNLGVMGAKILDPQHPELSVISLRMHATDVNRMPPLATRVVDSVGAKDIDDWITSITACP
jgi:uncharacterized repeat protein (TIGR03806 family)